jgi:hypothetical protein
MGLRGGAALAAQHLAGEPEIGARSYSTMLWPWLGASASRTLRGTIVRNSLSPKCWLSCADTSLARLLRTSYIVRSTPSISSFGLRRALTARIVSLSDDSPSSAKYSHCIGTITPSAAVSALIVSRCSDGGQSIRM